MNYIIGAGGHGKSLIGSISKIKKIKKIFDLKKPKKEEKIFLINVEKFRLNKFSNKDNIYLGIGNIKQRKKIYDLLVLKGYLIKNLFSKTSIISNFTTFGNGNQILELAYLGPGCKIGNNNLINTGSIIEHEVIIGNNCNIGPGVIICGKSKIGNNVFIGAGSTILENINIDDNITVGANSLINKNIKKPGTYFGIPFKKFKKK